MRLTMYGRYIDFGLMSLRLNVRFGSKADICSATHVRFTPNSDRESGFPQKVMSALPPKADICSALAHVCFGPIADMQRGKNDRYGLSRITVFYKAGEVGWL
jgi:hypothetical protein